MISVEHMNEIKHVCAGATEMAEGGHTYIHLPALKLPEGCGPSEIPALLCISQHGGYTTRLFLPQVILGRGINWTSHVIFGKTWHTCSWNNVPASLRPMEILAEHLRGLR
jgi:hypothetical protein